MIRKFVVATLLLVGVQAFAADENNVVPGLTAAGAPLGLHGADPVALIEIGSRIDGSAQFAAVHDGVAYYFDTAANQQAFEADPTRFVPQNGGFCTFGVAVGKKFDGDPSYAAVVDGKLYVFLNEKIYRAFNEDRADTIAKASGKWKRIRSTAATAL